MSDMCYKSALHDVNTLMTEKSIISTIDQIEGLLKTGQINENEFKKKRERILSLIEKLPLSYKKHNAKSIAEIKKYLEDVDGAVSKIERDKALLKKRYYCFSEGGIL
jgi:hypothetical protein